MKVLELIEKLKKLDPSLDVLCWSEDESVQAPGHSIRIMQIIEVTTVNGEMVRCEDLIPSMKIGSTQVSAQHAVIEVSADF